MEIKEKISEELVIEYLRNAKQNELSRLIDQIKKEFDIQETLAPAAQGEVQQKDTSSVNVSLKVSEVGKQAIQVYGAVKDIINGATGGQINIINAKQIIDQKKPVLENISKLKAEEYKKQLEKKGATVEFIEIK
jgi:ribosomal protein L7/L12